MTKSQLKNIIEGSIKTNGIQLITGETLQETLKTIVDNVPSQDEVVSGIKGVATQTNAPTVYTPETYPNGLTEIWRVFDPLTSPNSWGNIAVTQAEINANDIYFVVTNGVVDKKLSPKTIADPAKIVTWTAATFASGVQVIYNGVLYQSNATTVAGDVPGVSAKWDVKLSAGSDTASPNVNLYDSTKDASGYLEGNGSVGANATTKHSDYIPISDSLQNVDLVLTERPAGVEAAKQIDLYDENKVFLGVINTSVSANIFRITNPAVRFVRFNTVWVDGVPNADLKLYKAAVITTPYPANKGYETDMTLPVGGDMVLVNAKVNINNLAYVDVITSSAIVEIVCVNVADNATEYIKIDVDTVGYHRIPKELITTTFTDFYLGFKSGIFYSTKSYNRSLIRSGAVWSEVSYNLSYSIGFFTNPNITDFKTVALQLGILTGEFTLTSTIIVPAGKKVRGDNCTVTITDTAKIILNEGASISGIKFIGDKTYNDNYVSPPIVEANLTNYATLIDTADRFIEVGKNANVHDCDFKNIDKLVVFLYDSEESGSVYSNKFANCKAAILADGNGYTQIYDNHIFNPVWGIIIISGNTYLSNNKIFFGSVGYVLHDVFNGAHGSIIGGCANHLPVAGLYIKNCVTSQVVSGVNMFEADIIADYCEGLTISGSLLANQVKITNGKTNLITGTMFREQYKPAGQYFDDANNTLTLKNNLIQGAASSAAVNN